MAILAVIVAMGRVIVPSVIVPRVIVLAVIVRVLGLV